MQRRRFLKSSLLGSLSLAGLPYLDQAASGQTFEWEGKKILFLGDSITQGGDYINFLESSLLANSGKVHSELLNLGLASETISGLSEEAHPFPRPYLHDRLQNVLSFIQPDIIFVCYGINCGIYHPFDQAIFKNYQQGTTQLMRAAETQKAQLILMTPPPYAAPVDNWQSARNDATRNDFSYANPYLAYDDVMRKYADWIMSLEGKVKVIDLQTPMRKFQSLCYDEDFIHPNPYGHQLMAVTILNALDWLEEKPLVERAFTSSDNPGTNAIGQTLITPMPRLPYRIGTGAPAYDQRVAGPEVRLIFRDSPAGTYQLLDRHQLIGQYRADAMKDGIGLNQMKMGNKLQQLSPWVLTQEIYDLVVSKRSLYDYSILQHIGHERPMSREGLPIRLAEIKKQEIQGQLSKLLEPGDWKLTLVKVD